MKKYSGKAIYRGIAIGAVKYYRKVEIDTTRRNTDDGESEAARYEHGGEESMRQLNDVCRKALADVGEETAAIFDVQAMMLSDDDYNDAVFNLIRKDHVNAEYAVQQTGDQFAKTFADMEDDYMKARSFDIKDISRRILCVLAGQEPVSLADANPFILAADDLTPAETVQLDKSKVLAFVTKYGSSNSHTAILARTMNIPALTGVIIDSDWNGKTAVVDGFSGELIIEPDNETLSLYITRRKNEEKKHELLLQLKNAEDVTLGGRHIELFANISNVND